MFMWNKIYKSLEVVKFLIYKVLQSHGYSGIRAVVVWNIYPSRMYVTLAIEPRFRVCDIS
jgi:hypothetical protein